MAIIKTACFNDLNGVRELNTLLKNPLKKMDARDFYWDKQPYIAVAISENRCFVIKDGETVNAAMIMAHRKPDEQYAYASLAIGTLSVCPEFRKTGLGIQFVEYAKAMARQERKRLYVESFFEFRQLSFYKRLEFKEAPRKEYHGTPYYVLFIDSPSA